MKNSSIGTVLVTDPSHIASLGLIFFLSKDHPLTYRQDLTSSSSSLPTSVVVASTNVSVPIVGQFGTSAISVNHILNGLEQASLAFHILSIAGTGLSLLAIFHPSNRLIMRLDVFASYGGSTFQLGSTIISIILVVAASNTFNKFGGTLGLKAEIGVSSLVTRCFAWWFMFIASTYWDIVWFVEFRKTAMKRKWRSESEVGINWGVLGEVRRNSRRPDKKGKGVEMDGVKGDSAKKCECY
jgi:hypothetical protein